MAIVHQPQWVGPTWSKSRCWVLVWAGAAYSCPAQDFAVRALRTTVQVAAKQVGPPAFSPCPLCWVLERSRGRITATGA